MKGMWELRGGVTKGVGVGVRGKDERGFACAIQPHCEVRPESGLSIYEIYDMREGGVCFCCPAAP